MEDYEENIAMVENFSESNEQPQQQEGNSSFQEGAELIMEQTSIRR